MKYFEELRVSDYKWEGYTLWKYIKLHFPYYTKLLIIKEIRLKHILLNDKESYFQYKLKFGDIIKISLLPNLSNINNKTKREKNDLKDVLAIKPQIFFENENLIIINKKSNQVVQPDSSKNSYSLEELLQSYIAAVEPESTYKAKFIHRLDRSVEGLLIGAKNAQSHSILSQAIRERRIKKFYKAIVLGNFPHKEIELKHWIIDKLSKVKVLDNENHGTKYSESIVRSLKRDTNYSIIEIELITGRKNQIRAQLAHENFPIVGDRKYFNKDLKRKLKMSDLNWKKLFLSSESIALFSYKLIFDEDTVKKLNLKENTFELQKEPERWSFWLKWLSS